MATVQQEQDAKEVIEILKNLDIDLLVVDSYAIDETWERIVRTYTKKIMVIDDLANRKHDCDILLDQNYYADMKIRYSGLVSDDCKLLLGPTYALLREEFYREKKKQRQRDGQIKNILMFFGGSDLTNETMKTLRALVALNREDITVNVVVGGSNQYKEEVKEFCQRYHWMNYYCQIHNMAEMMNEADLAIGAAGTTTWERFFLGLPTIVIAVAENQIKIAEDCDESGFIKYLGKSSLVTNHVICEVILSLQGKKYKNLQYNCTRFRRDKDDEWIKLLFESSEIG
ncbi:UDP-2,4-diacetamido-2,4,6-trideoxy-beta-L-altropyranose hydrolase [Anaerosinus gibii]|uniref:UDP-2,4-diacetamido-2,4, 6-trideoxy-beta-L-altropyranose hydrolase n=1 Tax=Selenobaculum gibii TaxID=3054208 RepID=A0A9Y2AI49_9FIRM|nr:UDP-2,4-diacetamido-2,4,6-trideoxy-beta-L-altropyranose hydrolase [Selenobaculum gbiensis]WIW70388.1 UDP-2,4-diacetamido-2,4,6-trideoxy-beta-L-altropyranose hydrolase [Selenobaculum gbiensis]